jgi:hypothetical protein
MQRLAAIILCISTQAAFAQCDAPAAQAATTTTPPTTVQRSHATPPAQQAQTEARPGAELIKTAAAGTRDDVPPATHTATRAPGDDQDHPHRGGTAMLLAALALMSGIALRRYGASNT